MLAAAVKVAAAAPAAAAARRKTEKNHKNSRESKVISSKEREPLTFTICCRFFRFVSLMLLMLFSAIASQSVSSVQLFLNNLF